MDIVPIIKKNDGASYHRLRLPFKAMGIDFDYLEKTPVAHVFEKAKVVIFNRRPGFAQVGELSGFDTFLNLQKKYGFKYIVDLDDYWFLPSNSPFYADWKARGITQEILECIMNANHVFVTTDRLAEQAEKYNKYVTVIPNALPFGDGQFNDEHEQSDISRIIYAGGASHYWDLHSIRGVFDKISRSGHKFQLQLAGYSDFNKQTKFYWDKVEKLVTASGRIKDYVRKEMLSLDEYMNHYTSADLSLAPLEDNFFNRYKSNLKILEAGCKNIPIITSAIPPYADENTELISMAKNSSDWFKFLHTYLKNPSKIKEDGQRLGEYVREKYNLYKINETRKQIFNNLIN